MQWSQRAVMMFPLHIASITSAPLVAGRLQEWHEVSSDPSLLPSQIFLPASARKLHPVIVFLHGGGDGPFSVMNRQSLPRLLLNNRTFASQFPFIVITPCSTCSVARTAVDGRHAASSRGWTPQNFERVDLLISKVLNEHGGDPTRVSLTGQSMGGGGLWRYAQARRSFFAALVPVCAAVAPPQGRVDVCCAEAGSKAPPANCCPPVWIFHGANDRTVPVKYSDDWAEKLRRQHPGLQEVRYTRYEWAPAPPMPAFSQLTGHASYELAYREAALYEWLLGQRCTARAAAIAGAASAHIEGLGGGRGGGG